MHDSIASSGWYFKLTPALRRRSVRYLKDTNMISSNNTTAFFRRSERAADISDTLTPRMLVLNAKKAMSACGIKSIKLKWCCECIKKTVVHILYIVFFLAQGHFYRFTVKHIHTQHTVIWWWTQMKTKKDLELVSVGTRSQSTSTHWFFDCCLGFLRARCDILTRRWSSGGSPGGGHKPWKHTLSYLMIYCERDLSRRVQTSNWTTNMNGNK